MTKPSASHRAFSSYAVATAIVLMTAALGAPRAPTDPGPVAAASTLQESTRCAEPEVRAFDFWVGRWTVTNPDGDTVGVNRISTTAGGCGILEEWEGSSGNVGTSLTAYDPGRDEWFQHWVGTGSVLKLTGGFEQGSLVLEGAARTVEREGEVVELLDRITWTPLESGRVRQSWETSDDAGESWTDAFVGIYHPEEGAR